MVRNLLVLPDGREIFSGSEGSAVMSLELTESVSAGTELEPGAACATMVQVELLDGGDLGITAGDSLTLYTVDEEGNRIQTGIFLAQKPQRSGAVVRLTAYDKMILLDRDMTLWLKGLTDWPYSLQSFAEAVCAHCGLPLAQGQIPNADFFVEKFTADGVTGRQLISWVAQAAGCFCRVDAQGQAAFGWYTPGALDIGPTQISGAASVIQGVLTLTLPDASVGEDAGTLEVETSCMLAQADAGTLTLALRQVRQYYYQGGLSQEDYRTAPVEKVQLRQSAEDVGTVYPDVEGGNTLVITANPLLAATGADSLLGVARTLYERFAGVSYTPCTLKLPYIPGLQAGQILSVEDTQGELHRVYAMELTRNAGGITIRCTGSYRRDSAEAVNNRSYSDLQGKVLKLRTDVDGLRAENSDSAGRFSRLELNIEGIRGQVSAQSADAGLMKEQLTALEQTAAGVRLSVEQIQNDGATKIKTAMGYTFDDNGLQISREGQQMKNLLDNTGMYVTRWGQTVLQANDRGVTATDVQVNNFLVVGDHARFENFGAGRTACFYLEG